MKYFLDTNVIIDMLKGKSESIKRHFEQADFGDVFVPAIVTAELEYGAAHSKNYETNRRLYEDFVKNFEIIPFDFSCRKTYGKLRHELTSKGLAIGSNDMLIAATAMTYGATLVTHNVGEFARINGLLIEDWF